MPTRFYFPLNELSPVRPEISGFWVNPPQLIVGRMKTIKGNSPLTIGTEVTGGAAAGVKFIDRQYVSDPLWGNQVINGDCSGQLMVREGNVNDDVNSMVFCATVINNKGTSRRGTLYASGAYGTIAEFVSNASHRNNIIVNGDTMNSVNAIDGDRIEIQIGYCATAGGTTPAASAKWGEAAPDLSSNDVAQTTNGAGWFQFNGVNLKFKKNINCEVNDEGGI